MASATGYKSSDYLNALNNYMAELQRVNSKYEEFNRQRFTFIKAIERDHRTSGMGHSYIDSIQTLEDILAGMKQNAHANRIDLAVIGLFLETVYNMYNAMQGVLQLYQQLR